MNTKQAIQEEFIKMYSQAEYNNITIKELCRRTPVARTTFYSYDKKPGENAKQPTPPSPGFPYGNGQTPCGSAKRQLPIRLKTISEKPERTGTDNALSLQKASQKAYHMYPNTG